MVTGRISQFSSKKNTYRHLAEVTPNKLVVRLAYDNGDSGIRRPFSETAQKIAHFFHGDGGEVKSQVLGQMYLYSNCPTIYKTVGSWEVAQAFSSSRFFFL